MTTANIDRAIPFTLSLPLSQIQRMERVLTVASAQGMLVSAPTRLNKLAAEVLMQTVLRLENEFRATGLLAPAAPVSPGALPASSPVVDAARLASDPDARTRARAALGFGAPLPPDTEHGSVSVLPTPVGVDWDKVP